MAAAAQILEPGLAAIQAAVATQADKRIPAVAGTPAGNRIQAVVATQAGKRIQAAAVTLADNNGIPAAAAILAGKPFPADTPIRVGAAIRVDAATTAGAITIADGTGGIEADAALASGTTRHLTRTAPATTISPTIATPTAITISGATGILQPLAATPIRTRDINATR